MLQVDKIISSNLDILGVISQEMEHFPKPIGNFSGYLLVKNLVTKRLMFNLIDQDVEYDKYVANLYQKAAAQGVVTVTFLVPSKVDDRDTESCYKEETYGYKLHKLGILLAIAEYIWVFYSKTEKEGKRYIIPDKAVADTIAQRRKTIERDVARYLDIRKCGCPKDN